MQPKVVRILEPTDMNQYDILNPENQSKVAITSLLKCNQSINSACKKDTVFAQHPNDLLEGISDMFINANLSCNFAKKTQKTGWEVLSSSILNKLHPGNAIFKQQLQKLQVNKENFVTESAQKTKSKRRVRNTKPESLKRLPSILTEVKNVQRYRPW